MRAIALVATLSTAAPAMAADPGPGSWRLTLLDGAEFAARATLVIGQDGRVGGQAPCNAWFARGAGAQGALFGPIGSTKMACDVLGLEISFFQALSQMQSAEATEDHLTLRGDGREMVFVPLQE